MIEPARFDERLNALAKHESALGSSHLAEHIPARVLEDRGSSFSLLADNCDPNRKPIGSSASSA